MYNNRREYYKRIAMETMNIIEKGYYNYRSNKRVEIRQLVDSAVSGTELIINVKNKEQDRIKESRDNTPNIIVISGSTIDTIIGLGEIGAKSNMIALNFASAKNPGGGFQTGANAQEESIARASALYPCLIKNMGFYEYHRKQGNPLYSDRMIYSPNVPIFRDGDGNLLLSPILCSFITSPAVNAKVARERGVKEIDIKKAMRNRIKKVIELAYSKNPDTIILGAFGCGVFGNKPEEVAKIFKEELESISSQIKEIKPVNIIFAIYDKDGIIINNFKREFNI